MHMYYPGYVGALQGDPNIFACARLHCAPLAATRAFG